MEAYLGIDTSCYTTSFALVGSDGALLADERIMLEVEQGGRGLRQSEGVFQHIKNCGRISQRIKGMLSGCDIVAIAASVKPRPQPGSYMPVFTVGEEVGRVISGINCIPFYPATHQENHLAAGIWSAKGPYSERFLAVHLSGGTTELLKVERADTGFSIEPIGGTTDISAGQLIDRVGVAMGLPFPCGMSLEKIAEKTGAGYSKVVLPFWSEGLRISFSGPESHAMRLLSAGKDKSAVAYAVLECIAGSVAGLLAAAGKSTGLQEVLLIGGVSSNAHIKNHLAEYLDCRLYFPKPSYCRDNAVGTALIAAGRQQRGRTGDDGA